MKWRERKQGLFLRPGAAKHRPHPTPTTPTGPVCPSHCWSPIHPPSIPFVMIPPPQVRPCCSSETVLLSVTASAHYAIHLSCFHTCTELRRRCERKGPSESLRIICGLSFPFSRRRRCPESLWVMRADTVCVCCQDNHVISAQEWIRYIHLTAAPPISWICCCCEHIMCRKPPSALCMCDSPGLYPQVMSEKGFRYWKLKNPESLLQR